MSNKEDEIEDLTMSISDIVMLKLRGNDQLYKDTIEASAKFNKQLILERKNRIPFIDTQTKIAQNNSMIWSMRCQREKSFKVGQVYKYSTKKWFKTKRTLLENDLFLFSRAQTLNDHNSQMVNETNEKITNQQNLLLKQNSNSNDNSNREITDEWQDDTFENTNEQGSFDNVENYSDYDEENDEFSKRKKTKRSKSSRKKQEHTVDEKPYICEKCNVKYKTKPGLSYHMQKAHGNTPISNQTSLKSSEQILWTDETTSSIADSTNDDSLNIQFNAPIFRLNNIKNLSFSHDF